MNNMNQNIGKEMRSIRKYRDLTLRELGKKTGIPYSRLGKFECGKEIPTDEAVSKIEKFLDFSNRPWRAIAPFYLIPQAPPIPR